MKNDVRHVVDYSPYSNWDSVLDVWPSIPNTKEDQLFDYSNVKEWRYKTGTCPHSYHPKGYHPVPYPKKKPQEWFAPLPYSEYSVWDWLQWFIIVFGFIGILLIGIINS